MSRSPATVTIRPAHPQDFEELWRIDQECFEPGIAYSRFELAHYMRRRGAFTLLAEQSPGSVAGFIVAETRAAVGHIITLDVLAKARRMGLGSRLMAEAEEKLRTAGCSGAYLETAVDNVPAITFYKRQGYSVLKTIPRYYKGRLDALVMGKRLVSSF